MLSSTLMMIKSKIDGADTSVHWVLKLSLSRPKAESSYVAWELLELKLLRTSYSQAVKSLYCTIPFYLPGLTSVGNSF
jgi:hypothetical protein